MKKIVITFFIFFIFNLANAQLSPLLDYTSWLIEQIETDDQSFVKNEDDLGYLYVEVYINPDGVAFVNFLTGGCEYEPFFNDENQSFTTVHYGCTLSDDYPLIETYLANFFFLETYHQDPENCNCPYSYEFREEDDLIYLDITNVEGSVATFSNVTLSNTNFEKVELSIYPNPTSNLLHIETSQTDISRVEIFDVQGKRVMQVSATNLSEIDVSQLINGMYFLKVSTSDGELTRKFVKK